MGRGGCGVGVVGRERVGRVGRCSAICQSITICAL